MKKSRDGKELPCPTSVHQGLPTRSPPEILQTPSPRAVLIQDNIINVGGCKQRHRESQAGSGFGEYRGQTWPRGRRTPD